MQAEQTIMWLASVHVMTDRHIMPFNLLGRITQLYKLPHSPVLLLQNHHWPTVNFQMKIMRAPRRSYADEWKKERTAWRNLCEFLVYIQCDNKTEGWKGTIIISTHIPTYEQAHVKEGDRDPVKRHYQSRYSFQPFQLEQNKLHKTKWTTTLNY